MTFQKWFTCARCGFNYPIKYRARQNGLDVCTYLPCFDETNEPEDTRTLRLTDPEVLTNGV